MATCFFESHAMSRNLQQHILQTASELFYSQGIKATGVDAVVKAAGTTKMSLYKYFPSKDDLVIAHLRLSQENLRRRLMESVVETDLPARQKLLAVFDVFAQFQSDPAFRGCPFINASAEFADDNSPVQQTAAELSESLRQLLAQLAAEAGIADADTLSKQLAMLLAGAMVRERMQRNSGAMAVAKAAAAALIGLAEAAGA